MKKVGIVFGGGSNEHEVSIISAKNIFDNIDKNIYNVFLIYLDKKNKFYSTENLKDITFGQLPKNLITIENVAEYLKTFDLFIPVMHGKYGEDGSIQGLFEIINKPYIGCNVLSSKLCMDKIYCKKMLNSVNIKQAKYLYVKRINDLYYHIDKNFNYRIITKAKLDKLINNNLKYPVFIKPSSSGSSVGISKCKDIEEAYKGIKQASLTDNKILIEECILGREIEVAILQKNNEYIISSLGEVLSNNSFYSYDAKYINNNSKTKIVTDINDEITNKIKNIALKAFKTVEAKDLSRIDFFVNNNDIYLNEINTFPGFTNISMYPKLIESIGISYKELINILINNNIF